MDDRCPYIKKKRDPGGSKAEAGPCSHNMSYDTSRARPRDIKAKPFETWILGQYLGAHPCAQKDKINK